VLRSVGFSRLVIFQVCDNAKIIEIGCHLAIRQVATGARSSRSVSRDARHRGALHMLSQGFDIFGIHIQYWMLLVAVIATIAIAYIRR
jgi:hypothetical protein